MYRWHGNGFAGLGVFGFPERAVIAHSHTPRRTHVRFDEVGVAAVDPVTAVLRFPKDDIARYVVAATPGLLSALDLPLTLPRHVLS